MQLKHNGILVTEVRQGTKKLDLSTGPVYGYVKRSGTDVFPSGPKKKDSTDVLVWPPPTDNPKRAKNKVNTLTQLPSEILYKIASHLDDVGFVCLRNTCTRLRASLAIETTIGFTPVQRYLLRGLYSLNGVMNPTKFFCATCTERSFYSCPDQRPPIATLRGWRKKNVHDGRRARVVRCASGGWCEVGSLSAETKGEKQKRLKQPRREGGELSLLHDPINSPRQNVSEAGLMRIGRGREQQYVKPFFLKAGDFVDPRVMGLMDANDTESWTRRCRLMSPKLSYSTVRMRLSFTL